MAQRENKGNTGTSDRNMRDQERNRAEDRGIGGGSSDTPNEGMRRNDREQQRRRSG